MMRLLIIIALFISTSAFAQNVPNNVNGPLRQSGTVTAGDSACWVANNLIGDTGCGGSTGTPLPPSKGGTGTGTAFTQGSVVFSGASGVYTQDNAKFFWDDTNFRLGIGSQTPVSSLDVVGSIRFTSNLTGTGTSSSVTMGANGSLAWTGNDTILSSGAAILQFGADAAAPSAQTLKFSNTSVGTSNTAGANDTFQASLGTGTGAGGAFIFTTAPAGSTGSTQNAAVERMRIFPAGGVGIGTAALRNSALLDVNGGLNVSAAGVFFTGLTTGSNADFLCLSSGGQVFVQTSACTISSEIYKDNVESLKGDVLVSLMKLRPVTFTMKPQERPNADINFPREQIGLTAQNVDSVNPMLTIYEQDGKTPKSYRQESLIAVLIKGIQEQQIEIAIAFLISLVSLIRTFRKDRE